MSFAIEAHSSGTLFAILAVCFTLAVERKRLRDATGDVCEVTLAPPFRKNTFFNRKLVTFSSLVGRSAVLARAGGIDEMPLGGEVDDDVTRSHGKD